MPAAFKTYAATGSLPVWDDILGWHYPKAQQHAAVDDDWCTGDDFFVIPLRSQATPAAASVGDPFAAAVRSWMSSTGQSYAAALLEISRCMPDLAAEYTGELRDIPASSSE